MTKSTNTFNKYQFSESSNIGSSSNLFDSSSNSFNRHSNTESSNGFNNLVLDNSNFGFSRNIANASLNGWDGDNLTSDYFAQYGDYEGFYFGQGSFGGIRHFNK